MYKTEEAKRAIDIMLGNPSASQAETKAELQDIVDHCQVLMESLDCTEPVAEETG